MPWLCWELLLSISCMLCTDKGSYLNLDLMISGNHVVIRIRLMSIYVYMYVHMSFSDRVIRDRDCFMMMSICVYICIYVII